MAARAEAGLRSVPAADPRHRVFVVFSYMPMYGLQIAFKDYSPSMTMEAAPFVGLKHLKRFIQSFYFERVLRNTLTMSLYGLLVKIRRVQDH